VCRLNLRRAHLEIRAHANFGLRSWRFLSRSRVFYRDLGVTQALEIAHFAGLRSRGSRHRVPFVASLFGPESPAQGRPSVRFRPLMHRKISALRRKIGATCPVAGWLCAPLPAACPPPGAETLARSCQAPRGAPVFRSNAMLFRSNGVFSIAVRTQQRVETNRFPFRRKAERDTCP
jgi:hypothetical protein